MTVPTHIKNLADQMEQHEMPRVSPEARDVATRAQAPLAAATPMELLDRAVSGGASVETLERLMGLQERWQANHARQGFDAAISEAKAKIKPITKNQVGHNNKMYADLAAIAEIVDPILAEVGLSYRFRTEQKEAAIEVTCVLSHKLGHSEETTLSGPADATGNKNAIQAIGSTVKYLMRYALTLALGLATAENDDDGRASTSTVTEDEAKAFRKLCDDLEGDEAKLVKFVGAESVEAMTPAQLKKATHTLNEWARKQRANANA